MNYWFTPKTTIYTSPVPSDVLISSDVFFNPLFTEPKPVTINFEYSKPLISTYETIDNDPNVRKKLADYYYDLIRDKWLLDDINDVLNYYVYDNGHVKMIDSYSQYSKRNIAKDTDEIARAKVKYITKTILDRYTLIDILTKFTKGTNIKWVNMPQNEYFLKKFVKEYLVKKIMKQLK